MALQMAPVAVASPVGAPVATPTPAVAVAPTVTVTVPAGVAPGAMLQVTAPDGAVIQVAVPAGVAPGQSFQVQVPPSQVVTVATTAVAAAPVDPIQLLTTLPGLFIKQDIELLEIMTGFETENKYKIYALDPSTGGKGQKLFKAKEKSECCERQYCGPKRGFRIEVKTDSEPKILGMSFEREFAWECFCACRSTLRVLNPAGQVIGDVFHPFNCCETILHVRGPDGKIWYRIGSGCYCNQAGFFCKCPCPACQVIQFKIMPANSDEEVGLVERSWQGCARSMYTDADVFSIVFPKEANAAQRATLFAAVFVLDFIHFEEANNNQNHHH